ncbi:MAG: alpha/beta hydrolase [Rhodobacteraceae bacterium]|nr:alpha/beta hydrolase [Paracoccaceae bacterium]
MELDDAYANGVYIDGAADYPPRWAAAAAEFRAALGARAQLGQSYGPGERQKYDMFLPESTPEGTVIFVHGGYWRAFDRTSWSHLAAGPLTHGWAVAMPSYDLCPDVSINEISRQLAAAVQAIARRTRGPLSLVGHSAGGHLVARMLDRALIPGTVGARFHAVIPISPLSDLEPLLQTSMNDDFGLDRAEAQAESPTAMTDRHKAKVTVWVGGNERPAFLDQARWLADGWGVDHVIDPGKHHFDVVDALGDATSDMVHRLTGAQQGPG